MLNLASWLCEVVKGGRTLVGFEIYSRRRINPELPRVYGLVKTSLEFQCFPRKVVRSRCVLVRGQIHSLGVWREDKKNKNNTASVRSGLSRQGLTIHRSVMRRVECDGDADIKPLSDLTNYQQRQRQGLNINSGREAGAPHTSLFSALWCKLPVCFFRRSCWMVLTSDSDHFLPLFDGCLLTWVWMSWSINYKSLLIGQHVLNRFFSSISRLLADVWLQNLGRKSGQSSSGWLSQLSKRVSRSLLWK